MPDLVLASNSKRTKQTLDEMTSVMVKLGEVDAHYYGWVLAGCYSMPRACMMQDARYDTVCSEQLEYAVRYCKSLHLR